jgi:putative transposase
VRPSRFTDKQIVAALAEVSAGTPAIEVCRRLGITQTTFYRWRRRHGGSTTPAADKEVQRLRDENRKLKDIVTKLLLERD